MENYTTILIILGLMVLLSAMSERIKIASPILLMIAGITIGFIPNMPQIEIEPEIIFLIFLPPLLYEAAFNIHFNEFKRHFRVISSMAFGLVFVTAGCIAVTAHYLIPGMSWGLSFVLGAILAATDAVAAMGITKNLGLSNKTKVILEGESLINDASALVIYKLALSAVAGAAFVWWKASTTFLILLTGGALIGLVLGFIMVQLLRLIQNNTLAVLGLILLSPFIAYLIAEEFHLSGVIAVVILGFVMSYFSREQFSAPIKEQSKTIWDLIAFLLNGFIFILLGLKVPAVIDTIDNNMLLPYTGFAFVLTIIAILVRTARVFFLRKKLALGHKQNIKNNAGKKNTEELLLSVQESLVISWSGMRGIVSLAIAFALPQTLENGEPFPLRAEIIFITTLVILFTIVGQGALLPGIVKNHKTNDNTER